MMFSRSFARSLSSKHMPQSPESQGTWTQSQIYQWRVFGARFLVQLL